MGHSKVYADARSALFDLSDGLSLMSGGFGLCGIPENSIKEIVRQGITNIHAISNNIGNAGKGLALLLKQKQISKATCSFVGGNPDLEQQMLAGEVEVTFRRERQRKWRKQPAKAIHVVCGLSARFHALMSLVGHARSIPSASSRQQ